MNDNFDGQADINLLQPGQNNIVPGDVGSVILRIEACNCAAGTTIMNGATATGDTPGGDTIDDDSSDGSNPDPGDDGEDVDESSDTVTDIAEGPDAGIAKRVVSSLLNPNGCTEVGYEFNIENLGNVIINDCLLYTSPSPRDKRQSRMPSSA